MHACRQQVTCTYKCIQLLTTLNDWTISIDNHLKVDAVYIDFAKAFDTVCHPILILKLKAYGMAPQILKWLSSFLNGRSVCIYWELFV